MKKTSANTWELTQDEIMRIYGQITEARYTVTHPAPYEETQKQIERAWNEYAAEQIGKGAAE